VIHISTPIHDIYKRHTHTHTHTEHNTILSIACPGPSQSHGITWPTTAVNRVARSRCARMHPSFGYGPMITRRCLEGGVWDLPDLSKCSIAVKSNSLIIYSTYLQATSSQEVRRQSKIITHNVSKFTVL